MPDEIDSFLETQKLDPSVKDILAAYREQLKASGQYVQPGELKKQFTETLTVKDKNGIPIEIKRCLVCGHENYEVKKKVENA